MPEKRPSRKPREQATVPTPGRSGLWMAVRWGSVASALAGAGFGAYRFRDPIAGAYLSTQEVVLASLGTAQETLLTLFGASVVALGLWLVAAAWVLARHPRWCRRFHMWVASLALLAAVMGALAFFRAGDGVLGTLTLGGDVRLGGRVGYAISGPVGEMFGGIPVWQGALRVAALFLAGVAAAMPALAWDLAALAARRSAFFYIAAIVALKAIASAASHVYGYRPAPNNAPARPETADDPLDAIPLPRWEPAPPAAGPHPTGSSPTPAPFWAAGDGPQAGRGRAGQANDDPAPPPPAVAPPWTAAAQPSSAGARVNRFWSGAPGDAQQTTLRQAASVAVASDEPPDDAEDDEPETDEADAGTPIVSRGPDLWRKPPISFLLSGSVGGISEQELRETAQSIQRTLSDYGIEVEAGQNRPGPTVTMYGLIPGWVRRHKLVKEKQPDGTPRLDEAGRPIVTRVETKTRVRVDSILSREKDLALALKTPSIRIQTPVMGESQIGVEVPNPNPSLVTLRSVMETPEFQELRSRAHLPVALGKGSDGDTVVVDLAKMPHMLIAGATGSGKSVCINTIVSCLLMEKTPAEMRLLLVDPKRVELTPYNGIPHLLTPVVVDTDKVVGLLKGIIREMFNRYRRMEEVGVRNIEAYNERIPDRMPFLVVAVDELADLMMSAAFDVEQSLCRLAQLGRATGIHLIVATQRPSVDVVTGLIKANFPSRISFGVTSQIDSRTILDTAGAERLLGRGDMLYMPLDASRPQRVQGVYISDREIQSLVQFWQTTPWLPMPEVELHAAPDGGNTRDGDDEDDNRDELLDRALELAQHYSKLSTSLLQRRLRIGYPRAARLMDQLEEEGVVGPSDGSKSRDVMISGR